MSQGVIVAIIGVIAAVSAAIITGVFELLKNKKPKKSLRDKEADSLIKTNEHISGINQHLCEQMKILTERMDSQEIKLQNQTNRIEVLATDNFSFKSKIKELEEQNTRLRSQIQCIWCYAIQICSHSVCSFSIPVFSIALLYLIADTFTSQLNDFSHKKTHNRFFRL